MRAWVLAAVMASASVGASAMAAEPPAAAQLTLAQALRPDIAGVQPTQVKLSPDGTTLTLLRRSADDAQRFDLWAVDTRSGAERLLVDSKKLGSGAELSEAEKMERERKRIGGSKGIVAYDWAPDGRSLLVPLDGDLYRVTTDGAATKLAGVPNGVLNPAISPRGGYVSFLRDQNLWAMPLAGGAPRAVTTEGKGTVHFGEAEFVAQEEMARFTGYWWSPDDSRIAVERFDEAPVHVFTRAAIGASGTTTYDQRYPAAGTPNVLVSLYVMRPDGSGSVKVDLGANPDIYLARVDWTPDGKALLVQRQSRDQQTLDMLRVDPATGRATVLFTERSGARSWINLSDDLRVLTDGSLIWSSERSGYRHLYRFRDGRWTPLTSGDWPVQKVIGVDETRGRLYFVGLKDDPLEPQVYALDLARPGAVTRLTERGYFNGGVMDEAASRLIVGRSNDRQPLQFYLADADGKRLSWISENRVAPGHPYYPYLAQHRPTQYGTIKAADGSTLYWDMITPKLEAGKRYPVFFEHYGGPTAQVVTRGWSGALHQYLVSRGWIVFEIDNRGSPNRGKAFEDQIFHAMGTVEVADQKAGADYLKTLPFVDGDRIATYGWSYGGYMSLKMLEKTPGTYAAAVAGAPVTDWQLYDSHYTERYLGDPRTDPASYASSAAWDGAKDIKDPLLIVHGMSDDNVFLDNSLKAIATMQKNAVPFEMMLYPGYTHRVGGPGISEHLWTTILDFLDRQVKDKPTRR